LGGLCAIWYGITEMGDNINLNNDQNESKGESRDKKDENGTNTHKAKLNGIMALSPAIQLPTPPNAIKLFLGRGLKSILPRFTVSNDLVIENLSRDPDQVQIYLQDPLIHDKISLSSADSIFSCMEWIEKRHQSNETISIKCPVFISHGDADLITDYNASKEFIDKLECPDKHFASYSGGVHDLHSDIIK